MISVDSCLPSTSANLHTAFAIILFAMAAITESMFLSNVLPLIAMSVMMNYFWDASQAA